ncbi:transposase [Paraburkholderia domus]|uniref:transposase n=1 Tax=Paraburkholderia domus TaxID=2793075 RepID=UPI001EF05307|nr:transposase [Paraburkholderia domus]
MPHLAKGHGRRGPAPTLSLHRIFNYILQVLYMGCQWKMLPIERNAQGLPEIHYTRIYRTFRRWQAVGCIDAIFAGSVRSLHDDQLLDLTVIHGDGTTTAAKKGGDNLGYSGHASQGRQGGGLVRPPLQRHRAVRHRCWQPQ